MTDIKMDEDLFSDYNSRLLSIKKGLYVVSGIEGLDNGQLEYEMINLPNKEYHSRILLINVSRELSDLNYRLDRLYDSVAKDIYQAEDLKNQKQRELKTRDLLNDSKQNMVLTAQKSVLEDTVLILKAQADYYSGMNANLKKIYSIRNDILKSDKKIDKGVQI